MGIEYVDQGPALAAACEASTEYLTASRPDLTAAQIRSACMALAKRVRARVKEINGQGGSATVH